ncbi:Zn-dependent protease with chaperone function-like protein [Gloeothece citriformis PCC 7424]|uniref:Zn-dependent protease with chaperone function-like protein n=1 Tax=Gloeothece citriformis (strain PCC 7424) TaxID=65393 RepID=B7KDJ7_GLOC7|nr:M48 family metalloprotease [Gloeothece citriformis]ACK70299.1 Zn-dependent protease with chaperone function-like protein [Gloeothece citriformis PCC 7424]
MENQASNPEDLSQENPPQKNEQQDNFEYNCQNLTSKITGQAIKKQSRIPSPRQWRNAPRAESRKKLKSLSKIRLWGLSLATVIALFWVFSYTLKLGLIPINSISVKIQDILSDQFPRPHLILSKNIIIFLVIWLIISPWVLDIILRYYYRLQPLLLNDLKTKSPETVKLLTKYAQIHSISQPILKLLPVSYPVVFTYGNHPRNTCIVVSRGLLTQLTDEEIATIYGTQLGFILNKDVIWMTAIVALLQIPYLLYTRFATWTKLQLFPLFPQIMLILSTLFYGVYQFWRLPVLWLSRQRIFDSDYQAVQMTKNPNALCRALLKMTTAITSNIQQQGYTPPLLESFDLLLEIQPQQAITPGSLPPNIPYESVLSWDCINPYRHWLGLFDSHPLLGERLYLLGRYAKFWNIDSELDLSEHWPSLSPKGQLWEKLIKSYQALPILPAAILFSLGLGVIFRVLFWGIAKLSYYLDFNSLIWLDKSFPLLGAWVVWLLIICIVVLFFFISDRSPHIFAWVIFLKVMMNMIRGWHKSKFHWFNDTDLLLTACCLIIFSCCLIIGLNRYFTNSQSTSIETEPNLVDLLSDPKAVPGQGQLIEMKGILLGYPKVNHWLGQELILQTSTGLIKLKFMGLVGNIIPWFVYPKQFLKRSVTVKGWFRRGSVPVIDVESFKSPGGKIIHSGSTHFLLMLIIISACWGAYVITTQ